MNITRKLYIYHKNTYLPSVNVKNSNTETVVWSLQKNTQTFKHKQYQSDQKDFRLILTDWTLVSLII